MSDVRRIFGSIPTGRRLEQPDFDPNHIGAVGVLRPADEARLKLAGRNLREIPEKGIEGQGLHLVDKWSGETREVITSFCDLVDVESSGATAFTVRDSMLVPLRPLGWRHKADESHYAGEIIGRKATGRDPLPLPTAIF